MSKSPAEYKELFGQIHGKMTSKDPDDHKLVVTEDFKLVVESLTREFQAEAPGAEGMMDFAKKNDFDLEAVSGIWMAIGISAATAGDYQKDWVKQVTTLLDNVGNESGFHQFVFAMVDAYEVANNGSANPEFSFHQSVMKSRFPKPDLEPLVFHGSRLSDAGLEEVFRAEESRRNGPLGAYLPPILFIDDVQFGLPQTPEFKAAIMEMVQKNPNPQKIDIDEILMEMRESPEVKKALQDIADGMNQDLNARKSRASGEDEGPGF